MAARDWKKLKPWMLRWPNSKVGKCYKHGLSKARRRKAKMDILGINYKSSQSWENECDQKTW